MCNTIKTDGSRRKTRRKKQRSTLLFHSYCVCTQQWVHTVLQTTCGCLPRWPLLLALHRAPSAKLNSVYPHSCSLLRKEGYCFLKVNKFKFKIQVIYLLSVTLLSWGVCLHRAETCTLAQLTGKRLLSWRKKSGIAPVGFFVCVCLFVCGGFCLSALCFCFFFLFCLCLHWGDGNTSLAWNLPLKTQPYQERWVKSTGVLLSTGLVK